MSKNSIRVRFAPSPTGDLHVGGLRTALFNWLFAQHNRGKFLLRMEDTDVQRSILAYRDAILNALDWVDLQPDESMISQSERMQEHKAVLHQLLEERKAYRCFCSSDEIVTRYEKKAGGDFFVRYDGYCYNRAEHASDKQRPFVVRFVLPRDQSVVSFTDLIRGDIVFSLDELDDFIIARSDGRPMYNFAVVVDDAFMQISHVIRGEDHIANTPKQILLYQACNYAIPVFAHLPLILGPSGDRLSKRDGAVSILTYKREGYMPQALINYLARLGWSHGDQEIFSSQELIAYFSLNNVGKKGAIFDPEKLLWVNSVYIKKMSSAQLCTYIIENIEPTFLKQFSMWSQDQVDVAISLYKTRVKTVCELIKELMTLYNGPKELELNNIKKLVDKNIIDHFSELITVFAEQISFTQNELKKAVKNCANEWGVSLTSLAQLIRVALIGKISGPGVFALLEVIGKEEAVTRLQILLDRAQKI